ncbi:DUF2063 domain-containing protein [Pseudomonas marginalis]|uniref:HvfC/BufC N-terminal domain-containing protein n=1 Tax=Pseudomonas marginalis TaxID=298 RepID=UPI001F442441|nr:DNA-binding domain-containing protein [Pseudomonas marginalis]MCF5669150.1 DUF2063 domain-containing protein [Pseudomonas marginalis]
MNSSLTEFQDFFVRAIHDNEFQQLSEVSSQIGFSVYRNTAKKVCIDAITANFPTVERLVGTEWLRSAAKIYALTQPPVDSRLIFYGDKFPAFLENYEQARAFPYLADVAQLDFLWTQVYCSQEQLTLQPHHLNQIYLSELSLFRLTPKASCRWAWFSRFPAYSVWSANRQLLDVNGIQDLRRAEGAILNRKDGRVCWQFANIAECTFLDACDAGLSLSQALDMVVALDIPLTPGEFLGRLINLGVFVGPVE